MSAIALYMRVSSEDSRDEESPSIQNQRDLLLTYLNSRQEFKNSELFEFCDDGYSGTNFDRPAVQEMLSKLNNPIQCIIVKDFSRFGRNLIEVGNYLDQIFPLLGIRFIAVNENFDSKKNNGSAVGLDVSVKAMIYEMYSRDISEKIRSVQQEKMKKGEYLCGIAFYGYKRSATKKNKLVIDEVAAAVVRMIFDQICAGLSCREVAAKLNEKGILSPLMYRKANGTADMRNWNVTSDKVLWTSQNVWRIVSDERFTGCLVSHKRRKKDVSGKQIEPVPKKDWIVVQNTQEAIVSKEIFEQAQKIRKHFSERKKPAKQKKLFGGLIKCMACGRTLNRSNSKRPYFFCPTKLVTKDSACTLVKLSEATLSDVINVVLKRQIGLLSEKYSGNGVEEGTQLFLERKNEKCVKLRNKKKTIQTVLYEDFIEGRISKSEYQKKKQEVLAQQQEINHTVRKPTVQRNQVGTATQELLLTLVKEIRFYEMDRIEIVWNFYVRPDTGWC